MRKLSLIGVLAVASVIGFSGVAQADFSKYDLTVFNPESWVGGGDEYNNTNFWSHYYWNFTTNRDECQYTSCENNTATHSGIDFAVTDNNNNIYSYGFGKIVQRRTAYGQVSIRHLVNTGQYFQVNLLHSSDIDSIVVENSYIAKNQFIGIKSGIGSIGTDVYAHHLHFEVADSVILSAPLTANAHPGPDDSRPSDPDFTKGGLVAHYDDTNTAIRYYDPYEFVNTKHEAMPFLSRTLYAPTDSNYDVYGVADELIYGNLNLTGTFQHSSIVVRDSFDRNLVENQGGLDTDHRFLGGTNEDSEVNGIYGNNSYVEGDYLFAAYVNDDNENRFGYPVKFSFVENGDIIVDNDQSNSDSISDNDTESEPAYNGIVGLKVPGYFLTADLHSGRSSAWAQWKPYQNGEYEIYVHIPEHGATATSVRYVIKEDGYTEILSNPINQSDHGGQWVRIESEDHDTFQFDDSAYIGIYLNPEEPTDGNVNNYDITATQKVAFDAVKFVNLKIISTIEHNIIPPSVTSVSQGGTLGPIEIEHINNTDTEIQFNLLPYLILPNGETKTFNNYTNTLSAGQNRNVQFYIVPPQTAPIGTYTYGIEVNYTDNNLTDDDDSFDFTVTASGTNPKNQSNTGNWKLIQTR